jgi:hypothetical protein
VGQLVFAAVVVCLALVVMLGMFITRFFVSHNFLQNLSEPQLVRAKNTPKQSDFQEFRLAYKWTVANVIRESGKLLAMAGSRVNGGV